MFLSGFGVAGSMVGAVVAALAVTSAVVAFSAWPADPPEIGSGPLTLGAAELAPQSAPRDAPIVLPGTDAAPGVTAAASPGATAGTGGGPAAQRRRARQAATGDRPSETLPGAPATDTIAGRPAQTPPAPAQEPVLGKLGGAVDDTTTSLGHSLRKTTDDLGKQLTPLSPALGAVVTNTGVVLATTVQNLGATVAALLGHAGPQPRPR